MAARIKHPIELVRELLVKLGNIYKDCYLYQHRICVAGPVSDVDALGEIVCTLEPKYETAVQAVFGELPAVYLSIRETKTFLDATLAQVNAGTSLGDLLEAEFAQGTILRKIENEFELKKIEIISDRVYQQFSQDIIWKSLGDQEDLIYTIFQDKRIYNLPIRELLDDDGNREYITIAKQMLPLITEKTIGEAFFHLAPVSDGTDGIYKLLMDYPFTHFRMYGVYHCLAMPLLQS